ncbi:MAG: 2,3-bisphosphoglycerate-independent phosphoglycerate mutase [Candidatus Saganbacteria bacterium]|nr:2,3-bisphosphoglycerate-independent phosphoglycerate mutase [Candidatus Saganbacteria bacterium]
MLYLCILDGFGLGKDQKTDAIQAAIAQGKAPFFKELFEKHPYAKLECSGEAVGLPPGTMGNSEVNHLNMGAGRVVYQSLLRVNKAIDDESFYNNKELLKAVENCKKNNSTLHLMGLLQGGGGCVHGNITHLFGLLELAKRNNLPKIVIHVFTDGRDTNPHAAGNEYFPQLLKKIDEMGITDKVKIGTVMGRAYAMDRDVNWQLVIKAFKAIVNGEGVRKQPDIETAVKFAYKQKSKVVVKGKEKEVIESDEFIQPTILGDYSGMGAKDSIIFWNFRQDRAIELTACFVEEDKKFYNYKPGQPPITDDMFNQLKAIRDKIKDIKFVAMTEYYVGMNAHAAYPEKVLADTVGEIVSRAGKKQLRLAGPEKFVHVTGWFSGRRGDPFPGEDRILAKDPTLKERTNDGKNYDWVPEMTAYVETEESLKAIKSKKYDLVVHNFQNGDMVGHTGNLEAAEKAIEALSICVEKIYKAVMEQGGVMIVTADHGNADQMQIKDKVSTQHSTNPVPCWILGKDIKPSKTGIIPDIGTTALKLLDLDIPKEMTGKILF